MSRGGAGPGNGKAPARGVNSVQAEHEPGAAGNRRAPVRYGLGIDPDHGAGQQTVLELHGFYD